MTPGQLRRACNFDDLTDDLLRGTVYYPKRGKVTPSFLAKRPAYRVIKLLQREFTINEGQGEIAPFIEWLNQPFDNHDRLYRYVRYIEDHYGQVELRRYLLSARNAADLYIATKMQRNRANVDLLTAFDGGDD